MAEAARSARGAFNDIKSGAGAMSSSVGGSMTEARYGVLLLGEELGIHLPRGVTTFLASLGPVGAAMSTAFPFLAIAVGATMLIAKLSEMHAAGEKLTLDQVRFGTAAQQAFNSLDEKLLQSGIKADELRNDHMGALAKQLQLINLQSMDELEKTFGVLAKEADIVFADLKSHWYTFGSGGEGAKHSLEEFGAAYGALLAKHDDKGASDLLEKRVERERTILALQEKVAATKSYAGPNPISHEDELAKEQALAQIRAYNAKYSTDDLAAQRQLVKTLSDQVTAEGMLAALKRSDSGNASRAAGGAMSSEAAAAARASAESTLRINEQKLAAARALTEAQLTMQSASADEREAVETMFADRELQIRLAANNAMIAALDKLGKEYPNQLKALHEKAEELEQQHTTRLAEIQAKSQVSNNQQSLQALEQGIRESIEATQKGTAERLAAIDAGLKAERTRGLQDSAAYRDLETQKVETIRQGTEEENKLRAQAAMEASENEEKMAMMALAAAKEHQAAVNSLHRVSIQVQMDQDLKFANEEFQIQQQHAAQEIAALDKSAKDYQVKLKAAQDKEKQLVQQHENEVTSIKEKAEIERNAKIMSAESSLQSAIAGSLSQTLMGHKSFAATMSALGNQVVQGMLENAVKSIMVGKMTQIPDAASAARAAYVAGVQAGGPMAPITGALYAAEAFAAVMAFEGGGIVPGIGRGDIVPAMLTPGESVLPRTLTEGLMSAARSGNFGGGNVTHVHVRPVYHLQALDGDGIGKVLDKHTHKLQKHFQNAVRKMNG
jgi:hypothetical protein